MFYFASIFKMEELSIAVTFTFRFGQRTTVTHLILQVTHQRQLIEIVYTVKVGPMISSDFFYQKKIQQKGNYILHFPYFAKKF